MIIQATDLLLTTFRFEVEFNRVTGDGPQSLGDGGFQEVNGLEIELDEASAGGGRLHGDGAGLPVEECDLRRVRVECGIDDDAIVTGLVGNIVGDEQFLSVQHT